MFELEKESATRPSWGRSADDRPRLVMVTVDYVYPGVVNTPGLERETPGLIC